MEEQSFLRNCAKEIDLVTVLVSNKHKQKILAN